MSSEKVGPFVVRIEDFGPDEAQVGVYLGNTPLVWVDNFETDTAKVYVHMGKGNPQEVLHLETS